MRRNWISMAFVGAIVLSVGAASKAFAQDADEAPPADREQVEVGLENEQQEEAIERKRQQQDDRAQRREPGHESGTMDANQQIAEWVAIGNKAEIMISRMAQDQAQDKQVKQFAEQMVKDHSDFLQKLEQVAAPGLAGGLREEAAARAGAKVNGKQQSGQQRDKRQDRSPQDQQGERQKDQPLQKQRDQQARQRPDQKSQQDRPDGQAQQGQGLDFVQIKQQIAQSTAQAMMDELKQKQGSDFDKAYMGQQIVAHHHEVNELQVLAEHASGELQQVLEEGVQTTNQHLEQAKQIMQSLAQGGSQPSAEKQQ